MAAPFMSQFIMPANTEDYSEVVPRAIYCPACAYIRCIYRSIILCFAIPPPFESKKLVKKDVYRFAVLIKKTRKKMHTGASQQRI